MCESLCGLVGRRTVGVPNGKRLGGSEPAAFTGGGRRFCGMPFVVGEDRQPKAVMSTGVAARFWGSEEIHAKCFVIGGLAMRQSVWRFELKVQDKERTKARVLAGATSSHKR